jgi:prevent-host-death family protein
MMQTLDIHEAKANLSRLIEMAGNGEPFIIVKAGKLLVQVMAISDKKDEWFRKPGFLKGQFKLISVSKQRCWTHSDAKLERSHDADLQYSRSEDEPLEAD